MCSRVLTLLEVPPNINLFGVEVDSHLRQLSEEMPKSAEKFVGQAK